MDMSIQYCTAAVPCVKRSDDIVDIEMEEIKGKGEIDGADKDVKMMDAEGDVKMDDA